MASARAARAKHASDDAMEAWVAEHIQEPEAFVASLPGIVMPGFPTFAVLGLGATLMQKPRILVLTDRRLIVLRSGWIGWRPGEFVEHFALADVRLADTVETFGGARLRIGLPGHRLIRLNVTRGWREDASLFARELSRRTPYQTL